LPCASGKRTAKILFAVRIIFDAQQTHVFVVRFYYSARQNIFLPLHIPSKPNVILLKILCRAYYFRRTCVFIIAHNKIYFTYFP
jgi:hypothetical protein